MTAPRPLVSVITIFLNAEKFLAEAIQSVVAQTYDRWELLLVDDGSTDQSGEIAARYARLHPSRVRLLRHEGGGNRGMSASRNLGIAAAEGDLICFLDADDVYLPEKLERQVELMQRFPEAGMVYGATLYWYSWTGRAEDEARDRVRRRRLPEETLIRPPALFTPFLSGRARTPCTCGVMLRRAAVEAIGGFDEGFPGLYEDQVFFCKVALSVPVYVEAGCWDRYRQHGGSSVSQARRFGKLKSDRLPVHARARFVEWAANYLDERGVRDPDIRREVWKQTRPARYPGLYELLGSMQDALGIITARARLYGRRLLGMLR